MKKAFTLLLLFSLLNQESQAQDKLRVFKFDPLPLATSSLTFGVESFNAERTRSTEIHLGLRYKKDNDNYYSAVPPNSGIEAIDQFSDWKGLMFSVERRFYVPNFNDKGSPVFNSEKSQNGVYFGPSLRADFNQNHYDHSSYQYVYDENGKTSDYELFENAAKINYIGIMPALNFGVQFTIFQYAYIDIHIGGGIRFQSRNVLEEKNSGQGYNYDNTGIINTFVIREGVQPTGGFTFGLKM